MKGEDGMGKTLKSGAQRSPTTPIQSSKVQLTDQYTQEGRVGGRVNSEVASPTLGLRPNRATKLKSLLFRDRTSQLEEAVLAKDESSTPKQAPKKRESAHKCEIRFIIEENLPRNSSSLLSLGIDKLSLRPKALRLTT